MITFIDLSVSTQPTPSEATPVTIDVLDHRAGASKLGLSPHDFPDGIAISNETITLTSHTGTHMDAPLHYGPTTAGRPAKSIDQVPLDWCHGPGVRLDLRHVPAGTGITVQDMVEALHSAQVRLRGGEIVMVWTGADSLWGSARYLTDYPGLTGPATQFLVEQGIRVIGIDAWGLDRPASAMIEEYHRTGDRSCLWPAHIFGRRSEYLQLEKLANLAALPGPTGFTVCCFPVSIAGAGAGWTRVVAIIDAEEPPTNTETP